MILPGFLRRFLPHDGSAQDRFTAAYHANGFEGTESRSGPGSGLAQTALIRTVIPRLLKSMHVRRLLDCPCGDFHWMQLVDLPVQQYIGADIVSDLVADNQRRYGNQRRRFVELDLLVDDLPEADLLLCRDCFVHLTDAEIRLCLANIRRSPISYFLTTTFPNTQVNGELESTRGTIPKWRPLNLQRPPYNFPAPLELINEHCTEKQGRYVDKSMGLWRVTDLPVL